MDIRSILIILMLFLMGAVCISSGTPLPDVKIPLAISTNQQIQTPVVHAVLPAREPVSGIKTVNVTEKEKKLVTPSEGGLVQIYGNLSANFTSIQAAIDSAIPGDTILIGSGTYSENPIVNKNLILKSESNGTKPIIDGKNNGSTLMITADNVTISGLSIKGGAKEGSSAQYAGIYVSNADQVTIRYCRVYLNDNIGIILNQSEGSKVIGNNIFQNSKGSGIELISSDKTTIANNLISKNKAGISTIISNELNIKANHVFQNRDGGISLLFHSSNSRLTDNIIEKNNVAGHTDEDYIDAGMYIEDMSPAPAISGVTVQNNTFNKNYLGLSIAGLSGSTLKKNTFSGNNEGIGIYSGDYLLPGNTISRDNRVNGKPVLYYEGLTDKTIDGEDGACLYVYSGSNVTIKNMKLNTPNAFGIFCHNVAGLTIKNCTVTGYRVQNVLLSKVFSGTISGCTISSGGLYGLGISQCELVKAEDNRIIKNDIGIGVAFKSSKIYLDDNIIDRSTSEGIRFFYVYNDDLNILTRSNQIIRSGIAGMEVVNSYNTTYSLNNISSSPYGLVLTGSSDNVLVYNRVTVSKYPLIMMRFVPGSDPVEFVPCTGNGISQNKFVSTGGSPVSVDEAKVVYNNLLFLNDFRAMKSENAQDSSVKGFRSNIKDRNKDWGMNNKMNLMVSERIINSSSNRWNSADMIDYTYNGNKFSSYMGNYWSRYSGKDINGSGIGNSSYQINYENMDSYPLIKPFDNYILGE